MNRTYLAECKQLLQAFELTQAQMLRLQLMIVQKEFEIEIDQMEVIFKEMNLALNEQGISDKQNQILLTKQIERLLKFTKELKGLITRLADPESTTEIDIIFLFERQLKFKIIFERHLADFARIV